MYTSKKFFHFVFIVFTFTLTACFHRIVIESDHREYRHRENHEGGERHERGEHREHDNRNEHKDH